MSGVQAVRLAYEAHALCKRARDKAAEAACYGQNDEVVGSLIASVSVPGGNPPLHGGGSPLFHRAAGR